MVKNLKSLFLLGRFKKLLMQLQEHYPKQTSIAALFFKPNAYKKNIKIDYIGMNVPNDFLVGYGLDYDGLGRNLSDIYILDS